MVLLFGGFTPQYPGEKEITFPPFTCLESDGDPRLERNAQGEIVFFPLKVLLTHALCDAGIKAVRTEIEISGSDWGWVCV